MNGSIVIFSVTKRREAICAKHLRHQRKRYRKRYGSPERRGRIVDRVGIEERPPIVEEHSRIGDWEGDTVRGKGPSSMVALVERKSRQVVIEKVDRATAEQATAAIIDQRWQARWKRSPSTMEVCLP